MTMPSEKIMRDAISTRDKNYDGQFYFGVITTGVFCQPSCSSRAAKPDNLRFFSSVENAMSAGYRPCKRCSPGGQSRDMTRLIKVARYIEQHTDEQLTLDHLAKTIGLSSSRFQRVFKQAFGISPKSYQDAIRMRCFKSSLKEGEGVTDAIFSSGFGSISRVYGEATRNIGMTPKTYRAGGKGETIHYACRSTDFGIIVMAATDKGVCFAQFGESSDALIMQLQSEFPKAKIELSSSHDSSELDAWIDALEQHICDGSPRPDLPLDIRGTAFQMNVWKFLLTINEGEVLSYGELAERMDKPKAVRAVASACARNRIGVLIPCHRVLRGDGSLGGYRWGLERKRILLDRERGNSVK